MFGEVRRVMDEGEDIDFRRKLREGTVLDTRRPLAYIYLSLNGGDATRRV